MAFCVTPMQRLSLVPTMTIVLTAVVPEVGPTHSIVV
jgi:hypothetical protein